MDLHWSLRSAVKVRDNESETEIQLLIEGRGEKVEGVGRVEGGNGEGMSERE